MKIVQIKCNGEMDELDISINLRNIKKKLTGVCIDKGHKQIQQLYSWDYEDKTIHSYGWTVGPPDKENIHELPPNATKCNKSLFGDQFIIMKKNNVLCDINVSEYALFYFICCNDDCLSDDCLTSDCLSDDCLTSDCLSDDCLTSDCLSDDNNDDSDDSDELEDTFIGDVDEELDEDMNEY